MAQTQHTPGPWALIQFGGPQIGNSDTKEAVCTMWGDDGKMEANAGLIAAAPDMLTALRAMEEADNLQAVSDALLLGRAAIAKAEGSTNA